MDTQLPISLAGAKGILIIERSSAHEDREEAEPGSRITALLSPMLSTQAAADYVGVGANRFRALVSAGRIAKRGFNTRRPFHVEDLDSYLDALR